MVSKLTKPSEGFFLFKDELEKSIDYRLQVLSEKLDFAFNVRDVDMHKMYTSKINELLQIKKYVHETLWNVENGE